jgi:metallo-beta-lactamase family protein
MKITHIGAKNCVTGSCHLIQAAEVNLLVDCGIDQGHDPVLPFDQKIEHLKPNPLCIFYPYPL